MPRFIYEANFDVHIVCSRLFDHGGWTFISRLLGFSKITPAYNGALWFLKVLLLIVALVVASPACHAVFGTGAVATVTCSFVLFGFYLIVSIALGKFLVRYFPKVAYYISGGRM